MVSLTVVMRCQQGLIRESKAAVILFIRIEPERFNMTYRMINS